LGTCGDDCTNAALRHQVKVRGARAGCAGAGEAPNRLRNARKFFSGVCLAAQSELRSSVQRFSAAHPPWAEMSLVVLLSTLGAEGIRLWSRKDRKENKIEKIVVVRVRYWMLTGSSAPMPLVSTPISRTSILGSRRIDAVSRPACSRSMAARMNALAHNRLKCARWKIFVMRLLRCTGQANVCVSFMFHYRCSSAPDDVGWFLKAK
jgi:hypothetical protein